MDDSNTIQINVKLPRELHETFKAIGEREHLSQTDAIKVLEKAATKLQSVDTVLAIAIMIEAFPHFSCHVENLKNAYQAIMPKE